MPEIKNTEQKEVWAVEVIECERGWGYMQAQTPVKTTIAVEVGG